MTTETGRIELDITRDRQATFDPQLIAKYQRRFSEAMVQTCIVHLLRRSLDFVT